MNTTRQIVPTSERAERGAFAPAASGRALNNDDRAYFEARYDADFSQVRVHGDAAAAAAAAAIGANAFASSNDIVFRAGRYKPASSAGRTLLAHELAHVVQQRQGGVASPAAAEQRARNAAQTVVAGGSVTASSLGGAGASLQCEPDDDMAKRPSVQPITLPPLKLPPLDYLKLQGIAGAHGQRLSDRDVREMAAEWRRSAAMLRLFGLDRGIHLGPIQLTGPELLNLGLSKQFQDRLARENPNSLDRLNLQWEQAHPGGWTIPPITIFSKKF